MVSGFEKKMPRQKKNKNQNILAVIVMLVFFITIGYTASKHFVGQNSPLPSQPANSIAQQQQNPGSLNEQNAGNNQNTPQDANNIYSQTMNLQKGSPNPNLKTPQGEDDIDIISKKSSKMGDKTVVVAVTGSGRANPFLPVGESAVPAHLPTYPFLVAPPEQLPGNSDASKIMTTTISGILYDKYSPSAIINIEGTDYLVKKGDVINRYKILSISKTNVAVQLGSNVYQAGVGELLSPTNLNFNAVANLDKKFGGNDISIKVRKKGY